MKIVCLIRVPIKRKSKKKIRWSLKSKTVNTIWHFEIAKIVRIFLGVFISENCDSEKNVLFQGSWGCPYGFFAAFLIRNNGKQWHTLSYSFTHTLSLSIRHTLMHSLKHRRPKWIFNLHLLGIFYNLSLSESVFEPFLEWRSCNLKYEKNEFNVGVWVLVLHIGV